MEKDTYKYFENIIGWMGKPELHFENTNEWRPLGINYKININDKWNEFEELFEPKIMKKLFVIDNSYSVNGNKLYFSELEKIIDTYFKEGDEIYVWSSSFKKINKSEINYEEMRINVDTGINKYLEEIAKIAVDAGENCREHLIIVTDGKLRYYNSNKSLTIIKENNINFKFVTTFIIGKSGNLSISLPYCKNSPHIIYLIEEENSKKHLVNILSEDIIILSRIHKHNFNYEQFIDNYEAIYRAIEAKMIGADTDYVLIKDLYLIKKTIKNSIPSNELNDFNEKWNKLKKMANGNLKKELTLSYISAAKKKYQEKKLYCHSEYSLFEESIEDL